MFDPWSATLEQAMEAQQKWLDNGAFSSPLAPIAQASGARGVLALKELVDGGDGFAVLQAIRICVTHGLVAPEWLAYAFNRRYDAVNWCRAKSWDDPLAFGRPYPKGTNLAARRKARHGPFAVWHEVSVTMKADPPPSIGKD